MKKPTLSETPKERRRRYARARKEEAIAVQTEPIVNPRQRKRLLVGVPGIVVYFIARVAFGAGILEAVLIGIAASVAVALVTFRRRR